MGAHAGAVPAEGLPIHFFTIVLNGEPFIRYHEAMLAQLPFRWHWHVVEGVAALRHDTAWSVAAGGRVLDSVHREGRSNDGTSEYLDDLARRFPGQVTIYRKPPGEFWDGKKEMVNAPLPNIAEECLLWQIDNDELWTVDQIVEMRRLFLAEPERGAAYYWCWYFVGPDKVISTRRNYAQNPAFEWLRTWRFRPGDHWAAHEPPTLVRPDPAGGEAVDIARQSPFMHDETEAHGAVFQHFAYVTEAQLGFKETYYGYAGATARWRELLAHKGSGLLADYFGWVSDRTMFDDAAVFRVEPMARCDAAGTWHFDAPTGVKDRGPVPARPRIVVDGVYWQHLASGIGRVWQSLLEAWVKDGSAEHIILLDRAGTAPRMPGIHYRTIAAHDLGRCGSDSLYLERICEELGADLFVSTYYSSPTATPSLFFGHDMIPEAMGIDLSDEAWQEKARAIRHAAAHLMVSRHSARDLARFCPGVREEAVTVAHNGLNPVFHPVPADEVAEARQRLGLPARYALMVGDRNGADGYKNGIAAFRAVEAAARQGHGMALLCVGGLADIEPAFRAAAPSVDIRRLSADDATLRLLYAGAEALLYLSRYEGFGMPVLEAMACGCPVVTCANSSLIEVGGDAVLYVDPDDPDEAAAALIRLATPAEREACIAAGLAQAARFTIEDQARIVMDAFRRAVAEVAAGHAPRPGNGWAEFRRYQAGIQAWLQRRPDLAAEALSLADLKDTDRAAPARVSGELLRALAEIESMKKSPFWRLRGKVIDLLKATGLRHRS
ncbi:glycosyltransferase family 4 protein [Neoroseomonas alba]|nr:glycosyltransferase family 1 protein [Neoroseomonas alba]